MKTTLKLAEMMDHCPSWLKDAVHHVAKEAGVKTDDLELHRHTHSEKAQTNQLDKKSRRALKYVSARTQDRDDEIVIPEAINLTEFKKYGHVLVNHNYSLLPVGSDVSIEADDYGIKALTEYADTGEGTLANVVWHLVSQGHLKAASIGFAPTSFTKPGARDWDHVTNQLQSNWKEFDKARAEKSVSRIITGGVLLEHSDVSVPCNADAELITVVKGLHLNDKLQKQLGWEMKDGILVNKAEAEPEKCACDECGYVADAVLGSKCPECKTGDMKPKAKEKAITDLLADGGEWQLFPVLKPYPNEHAARQSDPSKYVRFARQKDKGGEGVDFIFGITKDGKIELQSVRFDRKRFTPEQAKDWLKDHEMKGDVEPAKPEEKANIHGPVCEKCGGQMRRKDRSDAGRSEKALKQDCEDIADSLQNKLVALARRDVEVGPLQKELDKLTEDIDKPDEVLLEKLEDLKKRINEKLANAKTIKQRTVKIIRPPASIKVLYSPSDSDIITERIGQAVDRALARKTGRLV